MTTETRIEHGSEPHDRTPRQEAGGPLRGRSPARERPEDDEAVVTAVLPAVEHGSHRERPEDDEAVVTYTREPACPLAG